MSEFMHLNMDFLSTLSEMRSDGLTAVIKVITMFGEELIPIAILCALYWCINKRLGYGIATAFFVSGTIVQGMKISFRIPRPWDLDSGFVAVASEQAKLGGSYSFPSGHTQTATALFGTMGFAVRNRWLKIFCFLMVFLVGFSRMYLGVHTPLDVVFSWILTFAIAFIAAKYLCGDYNKSLDLRVLLVLLILSVALLVLAGVLNLRGLIDDNYTVDSFKQATSALGFAVGAYLERRYINVDIKTKTVWGQIVKYVCGLAGVLAIKEGLKIIIGTGIFADSFRYFLLIFWIAALYPLIIKSVMRTKKAA